MIQVCLLFCILFIMNIHLSQAEPYVGVILEGFDKNCVIQSKGHRSSCNDQRHLYIGDLLITSSILNDIKIKWAPYAGINRIKDYDAAFEVYFNPPKDKNAFDKFLDFMGFVKAEHRMVLGSTRSLGLEETHQIPEASMLLSNKEVAVYIPQGTDRISIHDQKGNMVWTGKAETNRTVIFVPSKIGLKEESKYTIKVGTKKRYFTSINIISTSNQALIDTFYESIDKSDDSNNKKLIQKAALLQMYSDYYPRDFDLFYNSLLLLNEIDERILDKDDRLIVDNLYVGFDIRVNK